MASEVVEKPKVMEIMIRMDCNGCVQKINRALQGIHGISDVRADIGQQKLTVVGYVEPETIIKAIKKSRKVATVIVIPELSEPTETEPPAQEPVEEKSTASLPEQPSPSPPEALTPESEPPAEPSEQPTPLENPTPEVVSSQPMEPKMVDQIQIIHHEQHKSEYRDNYSRWRERYGLHHVPVQVSHSYNRYIPSTSVSDYGYQQLYPQNQSYKTMEYNIADHVDQDRGSNISSMFSDENPNACEIM